MQNSPGGQTPANPNATSGVAALVVLMIFFGFALWMLIGTTNSGNRTNQTVAEVQTTEEAPQPTPTKITSLPTEAAVVYTSDDVEKGRTFFSSTCSGCHAPNARGIMGLGPDLIESEFVNSLDDEGLHDFIVVGRRAFDPDNKTGIEMPAKGSNPSLTDENIYQIIAFLRTEADPSLLGSGDAGGTSDAGTEEASDSTADEHDTHDASNVTPEGAVVSAPTTEPTASGPTAVPTATVVFVPRDFNPEEAYNLSCAGCHGINGEGVEGYGPAIVDSELLEDRDALFEFLVNGNPDADVEAGEFPHPIRESYPYLDDEQLQEVIDYVLALAGE